MTENNTTTVYNLFVKYGLKGDADSMFVNGEPKIGRQITLLDETQRKLVSIGVELPIQPTSRLEKSPALEIYLDAKLHVLGFLDSKIREAIGDEEKRSRLTNLNDEVLRVLGEVK